jgi:hypothetical protein
MRGVTFIYAVYVGHNTLADHVWRLDPPGGPGAYHRRFLALMMGAPESIAPAPSRGPVVDVPVSNAPHVRAIMRLQDV